MENIVETIDLLHKRKKFCEKKFSKMEKRQITEYNNLIAKVQATKGERFQCKENITRNLQFLTMNKNLIHRLFQDSQNILSLPISYNNHGEAMALFTQGTEFIKETNQTYDILCTGNASAFKMEKIGPMFLINSINSSAEAAANELNRVKATIAQADALHRNISILQEHYIMNNEK